VLKDSKCIVREAYKATRCSFQLPLIKQSRRNVAITPYPTNSLLDRNFYRYRTDATLNAITHAFL